MNDYVLVKINEEKKNVGSIFIPENNRVTEKHGVVVGLGPHVKENINKGDIVGVDWQTGVEIEIYSEPYRFVRECNITHILESEEK